MLKGGQKKLDKNKDGKISGADFKLMKKGGKKKSTKKKKGATPKNKALYARVKAEAKRKFKVYPSAYANAWLVRTYKKRGGTYA
jgi:hypothetical protein|tara:strand:- start:1893 stop:2144 length:252 start_codon:yes stop_codon:yes gene_type:complete